MTSHGESLIMRIRRNLRELDILSYQDRKHFESWNEIMALREKLRALLAVKGGVKK